MSGGAPDDVRVQVSAPGLGTRSRALLDGAVRAVLRSEGVDAAEVSLSLLDDDGMTELNRTYLDREGTTDVIAFSLGDEGAEPLGDVYLGAEQARRQAEEHGVGLDEELVRLAVHGTLHVLGYDHPEGPERAESPMYARQEALVRAVLDAVEGAGR